LGDAQDFAIGTNGIDVNIISAGNTHTFNFPDASIANRGLITLRMRKPLEEIKHSTMILLRLGSFEQED
jgi:hypothetical protein